MKKEPFGILGRFGIVVVATWSLFMSGVMVYYGSFVIDRPHNPLGAEAQQGALLGFMYALPGLFLLSAIALVKRHVLPRVLVLAPVVFSLAMCAYFGYLRILIESAAPK